MERAGGKETDRHRQTDSEKEVVIRFKKNMTKCCRHTMQRIIL